MNRSFCQPPDEETVNCAETQLAGGGAFACAIHLVENPCEFRCGEIGVQQQAGLCGDCGFMTTILHHLADIGSAAILPDNGIMDWCARGAVPDNGCFALVGDADGKRRGAACLCIFHHGTGHIQRRVPYGFRVMFDPAILRENLRKLGAFLRKDRPVLVKQNGPRRSRALINGNDGSLVRHEIPVS